MSRVEAATGLDRLPWLPDDPTARTAPRRSRPLIGSALAAALLVGGAAFWLGTNGVEELAPPAAPLPRAATTVRLPAARPAAPAQPEVKIAPLSEVEPIVAPSTPVVEPPHTVNRIAERTLSTSRPAAETPPAAVETPKPPAPERLEPWPVRVIDGAAGRLVRVGAFSSVHLAKRGWWTIVRANPTLKRLPALVVPVRSLRNGRIYYRLQMGTTSQAHSAVLCQRMRMIAQPCVVIGAAA
ncbi:MAG: hypothetical protein QOD54_1356 [Sphingomonadales bacterium]|jgi:hypothetical protein|nr:hypothetical protein [Sphingomonadales bacterium]